MCCTVPLAASLLILASSYEEKEVVLDAGTTALFYSDGLVEAHDPQGEMFGFPRLRELVAEHAEERSLGDSVLEELYSFVGEGWEPAVVDVSPAKGHIMRVEPRGIEPLTSAVQKRITIF